MKRWIVVCLGDVGCDPDEATSYFLACRIAFLRHGSADRYAKAIHPSRKAIVVECPRGVDFHDDAAIRPNQEG